MSILRLNELSLHFEDKPLLRDVFFRLSEGERVGLIGRNGSGKTTVLRLILGELEPSAGVVEIDEGTRIGYFSQFSTLEGRRSIEEILEDLFEDVHRCEAELLEIEAALAEGPDGSALDSLIENQHRLLEEMERLDGWTYSNRIDTVLTRLGFRADHRSRPIDELSGGWRNRAALAEILLRDPDLLLLDEPTNYLDVDGLRWLETWIGGLRGAVLAVSHDRHFLDSIVTRIIEIENFHFQEYRGSYADYVRAKQSSTKKLGREFRREHELLAIESQAITDRKKALARPDKRLRRKLANIKKSVEPRLVDQVVSNVYAKLHIPRALADFSGLTLRRGEETLFEDLDFSLQRGERIGIVGPNGCGKTSLLQVLTEGQEPDAGNIRWQPGVRFCDFNRELAELNPKESVIHAAAAAPQRFLSSHEAPSRKSVERFLSLQGFSEMDMRARIDTLSGGQRARLALAVSLTSGPSVVVLDEPTNHLDMTSTRVMECALANFPGGVLVVSHDRFFLDKVATRLLVFGEDGRIEAFGGGWSEWCASHQDPPAQTNTRAS